jgi:hypothetical protein
MGHDNITFTNTTIRFLTDHKYNRLTIKKMLSMFIKKVEKY